MEPPAPRRLARACFFLAVVVFVPASASAEGASFAKKLEGSYDSVEPLQRVRKKLDAQVEKTVERMAFYKRPFARPRLQNAVEPCDEMSFEVPKEGRISIQCDDDPPAVSSWDGSEAEYTGAEGEVYGLKQTVESNRAVQVFESENGTRTNVYRLRGDTLHLEATLRSSMLPEPITFERKFERK